MLYSDLLYLYEEELNYIKRKAVKAKDDQNLCNQLKGRYNCLRSIMRRLKYEECKDFPKIIDNKFNYRNFEIDILFDDPGQQLYIKLPDGKEVGGGAYNNFPEDVFSEAIDEYLDKELIESLS